MDNWDHRKLLLFGGKGGDYHGGRGMAGARLWAQRFLWRHYHTNCLAFQRGVARHRCHKGGRGRGLDRGIAGRAFETKVQQFSHLGIARRRRSAAKHRRNHPFVAAHG